MWWRWDFVSQGSFARIYFCRFDFNFIEGWGNFFAHCLCAEEDNYNLCFINCLWDFFEGFLTWILYWDCEFLKIFLLNLVLQSKFKAIYGKKSQVMSFDHLNWISKSLTVRKLEILMKLTQNFLFKSFESKDTETNSIWTTSKSRETFWILLWLNLRQNGYCKYSSNVSPTIIKSVILLLQCPREIKQ